jgi:tetratricopeptide (TPR) repeat protein
VTGESREPSRRTIPDIWGNVPQRNKNFTGRDDLLIELRRRAGSVTTALLPQALHGLGGVGKTQLAIEYAYRYADQYQVVWWIPADQIALVRSTLAALAPRLGLTGIPPGRVEDAVVAVLDALRRGQPFDRWLLVFDNADRPEQIREFMPPGPGHVIVTSRNRGWARVVDAIEVDVFTRDESCMFLARRVPGISTSDADRLANELGDLPLALEQAAALLAETVMTVDVYLQLLGEEGDRILGENPAPRDYPLPVAAAWSLSVSRLREQTPYAMELLQRCAFFGPAPIPLDVLDRGRYVLGPPLQGTLRDPILMSRAIRALGRYSLARLDNFRRTLEVHRIIQRLIRNELEADDRLKMRHEVHLLLAASDPGEPGNIANWPKYAELLGHVGPAEIVTCEADWVRGLSQNIVGYLLITGDYSSALASADKALEEWSSKSGESDKSVLVMARLKAQILRALGRYRESYELAERTLDQMVTSLGENHEETLILLNGRCVDLRAAGDFKASLELNQDLLERHRAVFGNDHPRTLAVMNNLAEDYELNSDYPAARELNEKLYVENREVYLSDSHPLVLLTLNALARVMREEGHFAKARETAQRAYEGYQDLVRQHVLPEGHSWVLRQAIDYSAALRSAGADPESVEVGQDVYDKYRRAFGPKHASTLAAAVNLANARRVAGDLQGAADLLTPTEKDYRALFGDAHAYTLASSLNLSITNRRLGKAEAAYRRLTEIQEILEQLLDPDQHPVLICAVNLANAMADIGDSAGAVKLNERLLPRFSKLLGPDHPHTLTVAGNLALDLQAVGEIKRAAELREETLARYRRTLGNEHPEVKAVEAGERQDLGIEVPVLF